MGTGTQDSRGDGECAGEMRAGQRADKVGLGVSSQTIPVSICQRLQVLMAPDPGGSQDCRPHHGALMGALRAPSPWPYCFSTAQPQGKRPERFLPLKTRLSLWSTSEHSLVSTSCLIL